MEHVTKSVWAILKGTDDEIEVAEAMREKILEICNVIVDEYNASQASGEYNEIFEGDDANPDSKGLNGIAACVFLLENKDDAKWYIDRAGSDIVKILRDTKDEYLTDVDMRLLDIVRDIMKKNAENK